MIMSYLYPTKPFSMAQLAMEMKAEFGERFSGLSYGIIENRNTIVIHFYDATGSGDITIAENVLLQHEPKMQENLIDPK